jgi:beta-lactamase regulating signal transducer with metallopeptidase domain
MINVLHVLATPGAAAVRLLPILGDSAIKGVIVFAAAACAVALCRRRSAATRHAIWAGAVVAQLTLPVLSALLPEWRVPLVDRLSQRLEAATDTPQLYDIPFVTPSVTSVPVVVEVPPAPIAPVIVNVPPRLRMGVARGFGRGMGMGGTGEVRVIMPKRIARGDAWQVRAPTAVAVGGYAVTPHARLGLLHSLRSFSHRAPSWWLRAAAMVWLIGALAILGRFIAGTLAVSRLARRSQRVEDGSWLSLGQRIAIRLGVGRPMTLLRSGRFGIPVTWGIVYPVVLLPEDADNWTEERRRYVLVHEMAHVKRVDAFTQLIAQLALAAFWFDPFVWLAAHRMRVEREHACDDYVLREGTPASTYAADLLAMVRALGSRGHAAQPAFAALAMARPDELEERMHAILDPAQDRRSLRSAPALALALCSLLLLVPLAAFRPFGRQPSRAFGGRGGFGLARAGTPMIGVDDAEYAKTQASFKELQDQLRSIPPHLEEDLRAAMAGAEAAQAAHAASAAVAVATTAASRAAIATAASVASPATSVSVATSSFATTSSDHASCSSVSLRQKGTSTSIHESSDDDNSSFQYISSSAGRCLQVAVWGSVEFAPDERSIRKLSRDGRFYIRERRERSDRELVVTAGDEEGPRYAYSVDGERASFDDDGRGWLETILPEILRESGLNARQHVAMLRRDGGVEAVLADIAQTQSVSAKRAAYDALIHGGRLSDGEAEMVLRHAGNDLSSSDGELSAVLAEIAKMRAMSHSMSEAMGSAVEHISSDGEKRGVLQQYAMEGDRDMLLMAMRQARSISSDGEKAGFLRTTIRRYLASDDDALRGAFFDVTQTISSDGEKRGVLCDVLPFAKRAEMVQAVLDAARGISSDGEKAELLLSIAQQHLLTTPALRESFMKTTRSLSSDSEYRRVMETIVTR